MAYNHGVRVLESATRVSAPETTVAGLQVVIGTAPVNLSNDPAHCTNVPILVSSFEEAKAAVGYSDDFAKYTICEAVDASFRVAGVGPMVIINVLDPATHKTAVSEATHTPANGIVKLPDLGVIASTLVVKDGSDTLALDTDYTVEFDDDGYCIITLMDTHTSIKAAYDKLNPAGVTAADVIGSVNSSTGEEKGLECMRQIFPRCGVVPGLLIAPGWSDDPNVAAAMVAKCEGINGVFRCETILDLSTTEASNHVAVATAKATLGVSNPHADIIWPCVKINSKIYHGSSIKAAYTALSDIENDDVPYVSPSNIPVAIDGICTLAGAEIVLDESRANMINEVGVSTFNRFGTWLLWGNRTSAYPEATEARDTWFCCRRFFSWWGNRFILTYHNRVDNPANFRLIEAIVDDENIYGNSLVAEGKCAGAYISYGGEDGIDVDLIGGKVQFCQHLAPWTPAEDIVNVLEFDPSLFLSSETEGGEE